MIPSPEKTSLRRQLRALRAALSAGDRRAAAKGVLRQALRHRLLSRGKRVAFYVPAKGEIDLMPLMNQALHMGVECYLPVVPGRGRRRLWFTRLGEEPAWALNRFGIPEYHPPRPRRVRVRALDRVFLPLLGFDRDGFRIGMGGGYYDATLSYLARRRCWRKPALIGLAFSVQEVERAPREPWDIPLDGVLTERELRRFGGRGQ